MRDLIEVDLTGIITLERLELLGCRKLRKVLSNDMLKLDLFRIRLCRTMKELTTFGPFSCLNRIYISCCCNLQSLTAIEGLKGLKMIVIANCPKLQNLKAIEQFKGLKRIWIEKCPELQGTISVKELNQLKRILITDCQKLHNIEGIEYITYLESIIITACPKLQNVRGIEELKGLKEMIISDSPIISCVERLQILPSELMIVMGRPPVSDLNVNKIGDILSMADGSFEMDSKRQLEETIHSLHKTQHSLRTFLFCSLLHVPSYELFVSGDVFMANGYEGFRKRAYLFRHGGMRMYMCVVGEEMLSEYDSWMPSEAEFFYGYLVGVNEAEKGKPWTYCRDYSLNYAMVIAMAFLIARIVNMLIVTMMRRMKCGMRRMSLIIITNMRSMALLLTTMLTIMSMMTRMKNVIVTTIPMMMVMCVDCN